LGIGCLTVDYDLDYLLVSYPSLFVFVEKKIDQYYRTNSKWLHLIYDVFQFRALAYEIRIVSIKIPIF